MMEADCNHCWHMTGKFAPGWVEFKCCFCGVLKQATNYWLPNDKHGPHTPDMPYSSHGKWVIS